MTFPEISNMNFLRNRHFWLIVVLFSVCGIFHYVEQIGIANTASPSYHFGLVRHTLDRILFLVPVAYAGYIFGLRGGIIASIAALIAMLPRAVGISINPLDAIFETASIFVIGILLSLWLGTRDREKSETHDTLEKLLSGHKILQQYVENERKNEKRLNILNTISNMLSGSLELEELLNKALHTISELMDVEIVMIFYVHEETGKMDLIAYEGVSDNFASVMNGIIVGKGVYGRVVDTGQPEIVEGTARYSGEVRDEFEKMQIRVQLIVPLFIKSKNTGAICVAMRRPRAFTHEDIDLLTAVGNQMATYIENAWLYKKVSQSAQRCLISESNYRRLFENAMDAIWVHDLEGNITSVNQATAQLMGFTIEELREMKVQNNRSAESLVLASQIRRKLFQNEPVEQPYEQRLIKKDGTEAILMLTTTLVTLNGKTTGFHNTARDVTKEKWMQENLRHYVQQITTAQEEERKRISRDLHDVIAQSLYALTRQTDNFVRSNKDLPPDIIMFFTDFDSQLKRILQDVRGFSQDLRPSILDDLGLAATIRWLVNRMEDKSGIMAGLKITGEERRLAPHIELMLFRIAQESLRNVDKHAEASKVDVDLEFGQKNIRLSVVDDGKGFNPPEIIGGLAKYGKLGLEGMRERAQLVGGNLKIESEPGKGTRVTIDLGL